MLRTLNEMGIQTSGNKPKVVLYTGIMQRKCANTVSDEIRKSELILSRKSRENHKIYGQRYQYDMHFKDLCCKRKHGGGEKIKLDIQTGLWYKLVRVS